MILKIFGDLKISVGFILKELRCELSSSFDIISDWKGRYFIFANSGYIWNEKEEGE